MPRSHDRPCHRIPWVHRPPARRRALLEVRPDAARGGAGRAANARDGAGGRQPHRLRADRARRRAISPTAGLGLGPADYDRLAGEVAARVSSRGDLRPRGSIEVAQRVNVDGTGNVLDFCLAAKDLERLAYVSTAYVAGKRTGVVYEHELVMGQEFKNHYESTKFQAEVWVRDEFDRVPTTILRPAIVVGDSVYGRDREVRRAVLRPSSPQPIAADGSADAAVRARPPRSSTSSRSTTSSPRWWRRRATQRRSGRHFTSSIPIHSPLTSSSSRSQSSIRGAAPGGGCLPGWSSAPCGCQAGAGDVRGHPRGVDRLPQSPGRLRRAAHRGPSCSTRPDPAALPRVRRGDGRLLSRARGRRGVAPKR